jgi:hypothetical protein
MKNLTGGMTALTEKHYDSVEIKKGSFNERYTTSEPSKLRVDFVEQE